MPVPGFVSKLISTDIIDWPGSGVLFVIRNETVPEPSPMVTSDETVVIENTPEKSTVVLPKVVPPYFAVI